MSGIRYTTHNPGKTYPFKIISCSDRGMWIRTVPGWGIEFYGELVNIIGELEEIKPLEEWLKDARKANKKRS